MNEKRTPAARRPRIHKLVAAAAAAGIALGPIAVTPLVATAGAQSVLEQAQGGAGSGAGGGVDLQRAARSSTSGGDVASKLNPAPNWNAPGVKQGIDLVAWAKAGGFTIAMLCMVGLVPLNRAMKSMQNHNAEGLRQGVMVAGGIALVIGSGATLIGWMAAA